MKRFLFVGVVFTIAAAGVGEWRQAGVIAQQAPAERAATVVNAPEIPWDSNTQFLKYSPDMNLGEVLGVAVNSKGRIAVLNHPGSSTSGPVYGNASTQLLEFDPSGKFIREVGKGVYGLAYGHGLRYDRFDNLWVVDKGTHAAVRFNPAGYVTSIWVVGRRGRTNLTIASRSVETGRRRQRMSTATSEDRPGRNS